MSGITKRSGVVLVALVVLTGCGGNNSDATWSTPAGPYSGTWSGTIAGSDGTQSTLSLSVSDAGNAIGTVQMPATTGVVYNATGTALVSSVFSKSGAGTLQLTATSRGFPNLVISVALPGVGLSMETVVTAGSGTMTVGTNQVPVNINLTNNL